jgi:hypothetical protein
VTQVSVLSTESFELSPEAYAKVRRERRAAAIGLRRARRVRLGDELLVEFESAETLHYQAQEMLYVERVTDPADAAAEIAVYERLLPTPTRLIATMFVEIDDPQRIRSELERLNGVHESIRLEVAGEICRARDIPPPDEGPSTRTVSVHFLGFDLNDAMVAGLRRADPARLVVDHPEGQAETALDPQLVRILLDDIAADEV